MTNTDTADVDVDRCAGRGPLPGPVRSWCASPSIVTKVPRAVPKIRERLLRLGMDVPLIGDFHYIGHKLLADHPACAEALAKYRINPGNVGFKDKKDKQFAEIIEMAIRYDKPVRIGVNWGSLDRGSADGADGQERRRGLAALGARGDARDDRAVGADLGRSCRGNRPARAIASFSRPRSARCRT